MRGFPPGIYDTLRGLMMRRLMMRRLVLRTLTIALMLVSVPLVKAVEKAITPGNLPLYFVANHGQAPPGAQFLAAAGETQWRVGPRGATLAAGGRELFRLKWPVTARSAAGAGEDPLPARVSYFLGANATQWHADIPTFRSVRYSGVRPGIDIVLHGDGRDLEFDMVVAPGTDPALAKFEVSGARRVTLSQGHLLIETALGPVLMRPPKVFQERDGKRTPIEARLVMRGKRTIGFEVAAFDHARPLVIDPTLSTATFIGTGSGSEHISAVAMDTQGNVYVTGYTNANGFPTLTPIQATKSDPTSTTTSDIFIAKFSSDAKTLLWSTYLGGTSTETPAGIAVDASGNTIVVGTTQSNNFPTKSALQAAKGDATAQDGFIVKINPAGTDLVYATYLGGSANDQIRALTLDATGAVYVTGQSLSPNFPTPNGFRATPAANGDTFVLKLNAAGTAVQWGTFLGGGGSVSTCITLDPSGNVYVGGIAGASLPVTPNAFQKTFFGNSFNGYVAKINPTGTSLTYLTYLNGGNNDQVLGIAADSSGSAIVTGVTSSTSFPLMNGQQTQFGGFGAQTFGGDAFLTKFSPDGSSLVFSTYLGGGGDDYGNAIQLDSAGNIYVTGVTDSPNFPALQPMQPTGGGALFQTTNGGTDWNFANTGIAGSIARNVLFDPANAQTMYVATQHGAFKSTDGGKSWTSISNGISTNDFGIPNVLWLALNPTSPAIMYAATERGVSKTTDGGATWTNASTGIGSVVVQTLAIDPKTPTTIYAGLQNGGLFKSTDSGTTWTTSGTGLTAGKRVSALLIDPNTPATLYAGLGGGIGSGFGVYKSTNGGQSWALSGTGQATSEGVNALVFDPASPSTLYVATSRVQSNSIGGLLKSTDSGATWTRIASPTGADVISIGVMPGSPTTLYMGTGSAAGFSAFGYGVYKSVDGGATWAQTGIRGTRVLGYTFVPGNASIMFASAESGNDSFLSVFTSNGKLAFSTWIGGTGSDGATSMALKPGVTATPLFVPGDKQAKDNPPFACQGSVPVAPLLRKEGITELVGDIALNCSGGTPTPTGQAIPQFNIALTLNQLITNRPFVANQLGFDTGLAIANTATDPFGTPIVPLVVAGDSAATSCFPAVPIGRCSFQNAQPFAFVSDATARVLARGYVGLIIPSAQTPDVPCLTGQCSAVAGQSYPNLFPGVISGSSITWNGVPIDPPGATGLRTIRLTNVRTNVSAVSGSTLTGSVSVNGVAGTSFQIGTVVSGLGLPTASNVACFPVGQALPAAGPGSTAQYVHPFSALTPWKSGADDKLANFGTRLRATFNNIPSGLQIYVSTTAGSKALQLTDSGVDATGAFQSIPGVNGIAPLPVTDGHATAVWEVVNTVSSVPTDLKVNTYFTGTPTAGGTVTVNSGFAPTASSSTAIPRFVDRTFSTPAFVVNACSTSLLFPFVTNNAGFDTGLAVSNTTSDALATGFMSTQLSGDNLAPSIPLPTDLAGFRLRVINGTTSAFAPLLYAGPSQINYQIPANFPIGPASVEVLKNGQLFGIGGINVLNTAPAFFGSTIGSTKFIAGQSVEVAPGGQVVQPIVTFDSGQNKLVPVPVPVGPNANPIVLVLYATGARRVDAKNVSATIDDLSVPVQYVGLQGQFVGLDQINIGPLPSGLTGGTKLVKLNMNGVVSDPLAFQAVVK